MYPFSKIEKKWAKVWQKNKIYQPNLSRAKNPFYNLMMFPYPSAEGLHVGNMYAFTGSDIYGRYMRMRGKDVFEPIGLDGFGIHSENYAIKIGVHPMKQAKISEKNFYRQLQMIGNGFAWDNRLETYDPGYYRWTQWIFLQLFKNGLAYRKKAPVNWCPSCKTVLADEQVIDGKCERCDSEVSKKNLEQWFFRITKYAGRLLKNLDKIDWPERIKTAQRNWIGKSEGASIEFPLLYPRESAINPRRSASSSCGSASLEVFTTRPDTIFGATFLVLSPEHPFIEEAAGNIRNIQEVKKYAAATKKKSEIERISETAEKTGIKLEGVKVINPATKKEIPVWVSDYVVSSYGSGAIMAVPAYDERDFDFAKKFNLPIIESPLISFEKAIKLTNGKKMTQYRLRDWLISRQRYWGPPIPMIFCEKCAEFGKGERPEMIGWYAVSEKDLPVKLPYLENFRPAGKGESPLGQSEKFYKVRCPRCGEWARRETDVSDTFLDSAWYFFRYPSTSLRTSPSVSPGTGPSIGDDRVAFNPAITKKWLPVDRYIGGPEHAVLHLLYSRFLTMAFKDFGLIDFEEPFTSFRTNGLIIREGRKMSKSKGNVVTPDEYIKKFGADALRMHLMFLGPFEEGGDFRDETINGITRFLNRVWRLGEVLARQKKTKESKKKTSGWLNDSVKKINEDIAELHYNTAIAELMTALNRFESEKNISLGNFKIFLKLLAPFAPFISEELWSRFGGKKSIHLSDWPEYNKTTSREKSFILVVQVNGKLRDKFEAESGITEGKARKAALERPKIKAQLGGREIKKIIFIPGRLLNIVC
jgi:leucyl-tRNA synthetase